MRHEQPGHGQPGYVSPGQEQPGERQPIFNVPGIVVAVIAAFVLLHVVRQFLREQDDLRLVLTLALIPARYWGVAGELPGGEIASLTSPLTHMFVHGDVTHLMFNSAWFLAFGGLLARRLGAGRLLAFSAFTGLAGAAAFIALNPGLLAPVVGASGAVSGLMGGTMRLMFRAMDFGGLWVLRDHPERVPLMSLSEALRDRRVQLTTGVWLLLNLLAILGLAGAPEGAAIAWEAHVGGFIAGLAAIGLFDRRPAELVSQPPSIH